MKRKACRSDSGLRAPKTNLEPEKGPLEEDRSPEVKDPLSGSKFVWQNVNMQTNHAQREEMGRCAPCVPRSSKSP